MFKQVSKSRAFLASQVPLKKLSKQVVKLTKVDQLSTVPNIIELFLTSIKNGAVTLEAHTNKAVEETLKDSDMTIKDLKAHRKASRDSCSKRWGKS